MEHKLVGNGTFLEESHKYQRNPQHLGQASSCSIPVLSKFIVVVETE